MNQAFGDWYRGKRVLVTGHTGFKGSWLAEWLLMLGAEVVGYSLPPPTSPALFVQLGLEGRLRHMPGDVRHQAALAMAVQETKPACVFHLAAQPIVRTSYAQPVETYATNVMGTVNLLEAVRQANRDCVVVVITTDKCYENREWVHSYREEDAVGGHDPYSSSKACAELVVSAYRRSFFSAPGSRIRLASARAGNAIGGGDWAADRIVPDCIRALQRGDPIVVRNQHATRSWQHVLEPLSGYLWLGACLARPELAPGDSRHPAAAFNFGPGATANRSVAGLVGEILRHWPGRWENRSDPNAVHEAGLLNLATDKAYHLLGWRTAWDFATSVEQTVKWYRAAAEASRGDDTGLTQALTRDQIASYQADALAQGLPWVSAPVICGSIPIRFDRR
jgi:CDP-glucose 4,6-dehydratase